MNPWDVLAIVAAGVIAAFVMAESKFWLIWWLERGQREDGEQ